jgi:hypothetical protein
VSYFHRVVIKKPTNMMPNPTAIFHAPMAGIGQPMPEM